MTTPASLPPSPCPACGQDSSARYGGILYAIDDKPIACDSSGCLLRATDDAAWPWILASNLLDATTARSRR